MSASQNFFADNKMMEKFGENESVSDATLNVRHPAIIAVMALSLGVKLDLKSHASRVRLHRGMMTQKNLHFSTKLGKQHYKRGLANTEVRQYRGSRPVGQPLNIPDQI